eukprot:gene8407-biopygen14653
MADNISGSPFAQTTTQTCAPLRLVFSLVLRPVAHATVQLFEGSTVVPVQSVPETIYSVPSIDAVKQVAEHVHTAFELRLATRSWWYSDCLDMGEHKNPMASRK